MDTPDPDAIRARSATVAAAYPDDDGGPNDGALTARAQVVGPIIADLTGRAISGAPGVEVPAYLVPVAEQAFALKIERNGRTVKDRKKELDSLRLRSFSAGPYSETYFGPDAAAAIKRLDPDQETHEVLWALATPDAKRYWLLIWGEGVEAPHAGVETFAWGRRTGIPARRGLGRRTTFDTW